MPLTTYDELGSGVQKGAGSIREDLLDFIENLSPVDTPLFNNLTQIGVNAGFVEFLEDTLPAAAVNAFTEGAAATDQTLGSPSRNAAIVQCFQKHFWIAGRQDAVNHAGMASTTSYQRMKAAKNLKNDIELALHRGSAVSGTTSVAPQFNGLLNGSLSGMTASSGTTLTERVYNDIVTLAYSFSLNPRQVYCNMLVKRTISGFSTNVQRFIEAGAKKQLNVIDVYESEQGMQEIIKSRYQLQAASVTSQGNSWVAIDPDYFNVGILRPVRESPLGKDGDRDRYLMVGDLTLVIRARGAGFGATGHVANLSA
jgi:hypothetical protein